MPWCKEFFKSRQPMALSGLTPKEKCFICWCFINLFFAQLFWMFWYFYIELRIVLMIFQPKQCLQIFCCITKSGCCAAGQVHTGLINQLGSLSSLNVFFHMQTFKKSAPKSLDCWNWDFNPIIWGKWFHGFALVSSFQLCLSLLRGVSERRNSVLLLINLENNKKQENLLVAKSCFSWVSEGNKNWLNIQSEW